MKRLRVAGMICIASSALLSGQVPQARDTSDPIAAVPGPGVEYPSVVWDRLWISGQFNSITQFHPAFHGAYSGANSTLSSRELASSMLMTLFMGFRIAKSTEILFDLESAGGTGISSALGLAGFTNLDVVRNPSLGSRPYAARYMIRHIIGLSNELMETAAGPMGVSRRVPMRRVELRAGKLSTADFFDANSVGSDSHLQFMNWTVDNNGAYDYAADTRGYTFGALVEYYDRHWSARFMEALMPTVANGLTLDWDLARARSENAEWQLQRGILPKKDGVIRVLGYVNHANMGSYRDAINAYLDGQTPAAPDIVATRQQASVKYGFGLNLEQEVTTRLRVFGRWGWNEGQHESFAYTEVNQTAAVGGQCSGSIWKRRNDKIGVAAVWNAISGDHRRYLELGGTGFLLGDGRLNYGREGILETYYNWNLGRGMSLSLDLQHVANPGYNRDRGPIVVPSIRMHIDVDRGTFTAKKE
jgi:high affinity Mn2+ porin